MRIIIEMKEKDYINFYLNVDKKLSETIEKYKNKEKINLVFICKLQKEIEKDEIAYAINLLHDYYLSYIQTTYSYLKKIYINQFFICKNLIKLEIEVINDD